jgi:flagellar hook-associated protein 3 FlgL
MRITTNMAVRTLTSNINRSYGRLQRYQNELSSGSRLNKLSDDPAAVERSLRLRGELREIEQTQKNIDDGSGWLELSEATLSELETLFIQARGLAVQGASDTFNDQQRNAIADQVDQFIEHTFSLSQARYRERFIYAGTRTADQPYEMVRGQQGRVVAVDPTGDNTGSIEREITEGVQVQVNIPGSKVFEGEVNAFSALIELRDSLLANDPEQVRATLTNLAAVREDISSVRGEIGARVNRMELTRNVLDRVSVELTGLLSEDEDVDLTSAIVNLQAEQDVFQAALASGNSVIPQSLMDFIG